MAKVDYGRRFGFDAKRRPADIRLVLLPRCVPCSGNEVFALLDKTGTGQCLVAFHRPPGFYPLSVFESDSPGLDTAAGLGFPERLPDRFRPSKYLEVSPSPTKRLGSTRAGRRLGRRPLPGRVGIPWRPVWLGVGIIGAWFAAGYGL